MPQLIFETHFTLKEANRLLFWLKEHLENIQSKRAGLSALFPQVKALAEQKTSEFGFADSARYLQKASEINNLVRHIARTGVVLKDVQRGLVDFPHLSEGKEVFLCWESGEEEVLYWHELETGYAGRQPLYLDKPK